MTDDLFRETEIHRFLDGHGIGTGPLRYMRIGSGQSNVTYRIDRDDTTIVLRRGPRPPLPKSTHDMVREARILRLLGSRGLSVPEVLAECADTSLLGVPFYVMRYYDGEIITNRIPAALDAPDQRRRTSEAAVDTLVALHSVDITEPEIAALGRPAGYLERQIVRFVSLYGQNTTRDLPKVHTVATCLQANVPPTQRHSLVHGDYRLGNLMYGRDAPARVIAILDWEMATLGDPLADIGYLVATYGDPDAERTVLELTTVTREPGYLRRTDLIERYATATGLDLDPLPWYQTLALWKAAIFCEAIYTRWLKGERPTDIDFAPTLATGVPALLRVAAETASNAVQPRRPPRRTRSTRLTTGTERGVSRDA
jgi:aminoglycoside phosphotransferase (APT) family kinase protein